MAEFYEGENSCVRCLRSSPIASLLGFVIVLLGGGVFGGAIIFARRYLITLLDAPHLFPYLDYAIYGLIGALGLFSLLAYLLCALSSGWNAKHCFESSRKASCGRCCNMSLIVCLIFGILLWTAIACLISYPVISIALLIYRNDGPTRLRMTALERSTAALRNPMAYSGGHLNFIQSSSYYNNPDSMITRQKRLAQENQFIGPPFLSDITPNLDTHNIPEIDPEFTDPSQIDAIPEDEQEEEGFLSIGSTISPTARTPILTNESGNLMSKTNQIPQEPAKSANEHSSSMIEKGIDHLGSVVPGQVLQSPIRNALSATESVKEFFRCSADLLDLSYYGLYNQDGLPIFMSRINFAERIRDILICVGLAVAGIFLLILGYLQIIICTAINYARMQESRYYEASDAGEEGVALQQ